MIGSKVTFCAILFCTHGEEKDIDLSELQPDSVIRYYSALIMFYNAMNSRLMKDLKAVTSKTLEKLRSTKLVQFGENDFKEILSLAEKSLEKFNDFWNCPKEYSTRVYHYRLLEWLRLNMRSGTNKNPDLETKIDDIIENYYATIRTLLIDILHREIEQHTRPIKTLNELKNISPGEDQIMDFCFKLVNDEYMVEMKNPPMPYCNHVDLYESLLTEINAESYKFYSAFHTFPCNILIQVYEATRAKCDKKYKRTDGTTIILDPTDPVKYYRDVITLFGQALEKKMYLEVGDENIYQKVLQVENFPTGNPLMKDLKISALAILNEEVIFIYDSDIKSYESSETLKNDLRTFYGRLLIWIYVHIEKIGNIALSVQTTLLKIIRSPRAGYLLQDQENLQKFKQDLYLEIKQFDDLMKFCESGKESDLDPSIVQKTKNSLYYESNQLKVSDLF